MRSYRLFLVFLFTRMIAFPQGTYCWPIDFINISGNYGEIRPNHFHAGIDFSTSREENFPIFSADSGYVSRIRISPYGYGRALYITHPNGTTSLYGHQNRFNKALWAYVKEQQYLKQSYEIELFPQPGQFPVKKGELIGYSGNTGGSTGPHLHFEIRDTKTEVPLNPLLFYKYLDTVKPIVRAIALYDLSDALKPQYITAVKVRSKRDSLYLSNDSLKLNYSVIGIAFCGDDIDKADGNPNNIYDVKLSIDSIPVYHHQLNHIAFDQARYVNVFSEVIDRQKFQKCFTPKLYPGEMYRRLVKNGVLNLDNNYHRIDMTFTDEAGNSSRLRFWIKAEKLSATFQYMSTPLFVSCEKDYAYSFDDVSLNIPAGTLYNDAELKIKSEPKDAGSFFIDPVSAVFRSAGTVRIRLPERFANRAAKTILLNNGSVCIPAVKDGINEYHFKSFGKFQLAIDTIAPLIKPALPLSRLKKSFAHAERLTFLITDNLSGIDSYAVYVNGRWVLAEYDAKADQLIYVFDENMPKGELEIRAEATDRVGNKKTFTVKLKR